MNILKLTLANLKRYIKSPMLILPIILTPFTLILLLTLFNNSSDNSIYTPKVALVCDINGKYEKQLIKELDSSETTFYLNEKNEAIDLLKNNKVSSVFVFNKDFSKDIDNIKRPYIEEYKTSDGGGSIWAKSKIETFINNSLKNKIDPNISSKLVVSNVIEKKSFADGNSFTIIFMICYCLYLCCTFLAKDLLDLRSANVLTRMISTKNKDFEIIFSIFFALFLVQSLATSFLLIFLKFTMSFNLTLNSLLLVIGNCFVSTGFVMILTRLFKSEVGISMCCTFYSIISVTLALPLFLDSFAIDIPFINNLAKLTPIYWTLHSLINNSIGINVFFLVLIGLIFVTAGSFNLKDFAKN